MHNYNLDPTQVPLVAWPGASGFRYTLELGRIGAAFNDVSGCYIFCKSAGICAWEAVYVGEAESLYKRLTAGLTHHHRLVSALRHGATHICAMRFDGTPQQRLWIETDLRHGLNPPCNLQ